MPNTLYQKLEDAICDRLENYTNRDWDITPFGHLVIDEFLPTELVEAVHNSLHEFVNKSREEWKLYDNPLEKKGLMNDWSKFPNEVYCFFLALNSTRVTNQISLISGIDGLVPDVGLHGGGVHLHTRGGKLNVHQDYSLHPRSGLQRRLNIIMYLNPEWNAIWGGGLGLYTEKRDEEAPDKLVKTIDCLFNRAVIFDTAPGSWHGLPDPITCPNERIRMSLAFYYTREPVLDAPKRGAVRFAPTLEQSTDPRIQELIIKRSNPNTAKDTYKS